MIERDGEVLARIRRKRLSLLRNHYRVALVDGSELDVSGEILDREFAVEYDGELLAVISPAAGSASATPTAWTSYGTTPIRRC